MPDVYFHRDPEEIEKEDQAAAEKAVTKEEFQDEWTALAPEFTAIQPEVAEWSKVNLKERANFQESSLIEFVGQSLMRGGDDHRL
ncbi:40S ribosomal protein SA [Sciurus carolinensis]|uniref:40S ribosomal protein SA n=1 Tax=Sciurus carolinensis TaxID=30640 RepID=A0AA41T661_SCICA|nr:40S ribosomal protein SA [Sciurus carolinensis]